MMHTIFFPPRQPRVRCDTRQLPDTRNPVYVEKRELQERNERGIFFSLNSGTLSHRTFGDHKHVVFILHIISLSRRGVAAAFGGRYSVLGNIWDRQVSPLRASWSKTRTECLWKSLLFVILETNVNAQQERRNGMSKFDAGNALILCDSNYGWQLLVIFYNSLGVCPLLLLFVVRAVKAQKGVVVNP